MGGTSIHAVMSIGTKSNVPYTSHQKRRISFIVLRRHNIREIVPRCRDNPVKHTTKLMFDVE